MRFSSRSPVLLSVTECILLIQRERKLGRCSVPARILLVDDNEVILHELRS